MMQNKILTDYKKGAEFELRFFPSSWCESENTLFFVCEDGDDIIGIIGLKIILDTAEVLCVATDEKYRGKGVATALMNEALSECRKRGIAEINLEVRASNDAVHLYNKCGFETVGTRKNYYTAPTEDALLMTRRLK